MQTDLTLQEKKDQRVAAVVSVVFHALVLLLLFYMMAWRAKNPPDPEMGIEIALGFDAAGSGDVRTSAVPNPSPVTEDSRPPETAPEVTPTPPTPPAPAEPVKVEAAPKVEPVTTTTAESPVVVKKEEVKPKPTPQPKEEPVKPREEVVKKEEPVKEPEKPKTLFPGKPRTETGGTGTAGSTNATTGNSSGDDANVAGAKGSPEGNAKSTYPGAGKPGGGAGGSNLQMPGWRWDREPRPNDTSNESGRLVFRVRINGDGTIESVQKIESNVSPAIEKLYRDAIFNTSFSRTNATSVSSDGATGIVSFTIQAR